MHTDHEAAAKNLFFIHHYSLTSQFPHVISSIYLILQAGLCSNVAGNATCYLRKTDDAEISILLFDSHITLHNYI